jgi:predicted methyltransferase
MRPHRFALLSVSLSFALLLTACGESSTPGPADEPVAEAAPEPMAAAVDPAILDHPARNDDARYRDAGIKPVELYEFFGFAPGMNVADFMPGGGYNTVLLSQIVGDEGSVTAILAARPSDDAERVERGRSRFEESVAPFELANLTIVPDPSALPDNSVDILLTVRNYHDLGPTADRIAALPELMRILSPGGIFAVVDAYTDKPDERDESVHRINSDLVMSELTGAGFEFVEASDMLMNPDDTFDFDGRERAGQRGATEDAPIHRYYVSRFVHKYRKPMQ